MSAVLIATGSGLVVAFLAIAWRWVTASLSNAPVGWNRLPMQRRRAIRRVVLRGEAVVGSEEEARIAADLAVRLASGFNVRRRAFQACVCVAATAYWTVAAQTTHDRVYLILAALYGSFAPVLLWRSRQTAQRLEAAYAANSKVGYHAA